MNINEMNYKQLREAAKAEGISLKGNPSAKALRAALSKAEEPKPVPKVTRRRGRPVRVADEVFISSWNKADNRNDALKLMKLDDTPANRNFVSVRAFHLRNGCKSAKTGQPTRVPVALKLLPRGVRKKS
jgi:hypothetical protein